MRWCHCVSPLLNYRPSFALLLTLFTLLIALIPAVLIWIVFSDVMNTSLALLGSTTTSSVTNISSQMQDMLLDQALQVLAVRLTEAANEMTSQVAFLNTLQAASLDHHPAQTSPQVMFDRCGVRNFVAMKGHESFSFISVGGTYFPDGASRPGCRTWEVVWQAVDYSVDPSEDNARTIYYSQLAMFPDMSASRRQVWYPNQTNANKLRLLEEERVPPRDSPVVAGTEGWADDVSFGVWTGQLEVTVCRWLPAQNATGVYVVLALSVQNISQELHDHLKDPQLDRLFIFFRKPHGHLIGASHGKVHSHSDVVPLQVDPFRAAPDLRLWRQFDCTESTDPFIAAACANLSASSKSRWTDIPEGTQEMTLQGLRYWVAVQHGSAYFNVTAVLLKNRDLVMGEIDASDGLVTAQVTSNKNTTIVILCIVTCLSVVLPLGVGLWLGRRLLSLAAAMDEIATLHFADRTQPPAMFRELHQFQRSFMQMERGLQAFGKFVPQSVVKVLVAGSMHAHERMVNRVLTIMFADIEGFSTICESISCDQLAEVCTEYFESMCAHIVRRNGTIDKFIGDCIMAMWNAPLPAEGHELDAVSAAVAMQRSISELHPNWRARGLPSLKFRLGIHTGDCLVGNFGCSYRVSYTCLGDTVNLASRLEAINKKFGTYLCVSHTTYMATRDRFRFRFLSKVTVPGKTEVLPVYELLCPRPAADGSAGMTCPNRPMNDDYGDKEDTPLNPAPASTSAESPPSCHRSPHTQVLYRWCLVEEEALLVHTAAYEQAYHALVAGDHAGALHSLAAESALAASDKAWAALQQQCERQGAPGAPPWDGVFYFSEK